MRILAVSNFYPPDMHGGYEHGCSLVLSQLVSRGHEVSVLTRRGGATLGLAGERIVPVLSYYADGDLRAVLLRPFHNATEARHIEAYAERFQPELIYLWNCVGMSQSTLRKVINQAPTVVYAASAWLRHWCAGERSIDPAVNAVLKIGRGQPNLAILGSTFCRRLDRRWVEGIASFPCHVQFDSAFLKADAVRAGLACEDATVIPHPVAPHFFRRPRADGGGSIKAPRLLYVGRITAEKGILTLLRGVDRLRRTLPGTTATLVGPIQPRFKRCLTEAIDMLDLANAVRLRTMVSNALLPQIFCRHDILVLPSEWPEPFGIVLAEALAAGLPAVSSGVGGTREAAPPEHGGTCFRPGDHRNLAEVIEAICGDGSSRLGKIEAGRLYAERTFSQEHIAERTERDLERIVGS